MAAPRIKIQGKTYKVPGLDDLSLDDILMLDAELQERYGSSWVKVQRYSQEMADLQDTLSAEDFARASEEHPTATLMAGVTVWMVLRCAGQSDITMREALAIPANSVEEVIAPPAPKDRQPKKRKPPKASAPAAPDAPSTPPAISSLPTTSSERSASA